MALMSDLVSRARVILQDPEAVRWSDADLLLYANEALAMAKHARPDLFLGSFESDVIPLVAGATFPLPMYYEAIFVDYIDSRAHFREIEFNSDPRAASLFELFKKQLVSP